jgi:hypothetical protein
LHVTLRFSDINYASPKIPYLLSTVAQHTKKIKNIDLIIETFAEYTRKGKPKK